MVADERNKPANLHLRGPFLLQTAAFSGVVIYNGGLYNLSDARQIMATGLGRFANALAIGVGAGMEGYGKGKMSLLLEQRKTAIAEVKARGDAQKKKDEQVWRSEEAVKTRQHDTEESELTREWDREKFGLKEAGDNNRSESRIAAQMTLERMRGNKSGGAADKRTATEKDAASLAKLRGDAESGDPEAVRLLKAFEDESGITQRAKSGGSTSDGRTSTEKNAEVHARLAAEAESGDPEAVRRLKSFETVGGYGAKAAKGSGVSSLQYSKARDDKRAAIDPYGQMVQSGKSAELESMITEQLNSVGIYNPSTGGTTSKAVPAPPPTDKTTPPSPVEKKQDAPAGAGSQEDPYVATSLDELERLYNEAKTGSAIFVRYNNQLRKLQK